MNEKRRSIQQQTLDLARETRQAVLGVDGTEEKGMAGDLREVKTDVKAHGRSLEHLCALHEPGHTHMAESGGSRKKTARWIGALGAVLAAAIAALIQAFRGNPTPP